MTPYETAEQRRNPQTGETRDPTKKSPTVLLWPATIRDGAGKGGPSNTGAEARP